jgi:hypothetical protein
MAAACSLVHVVVVGVAAVMGSQHACAEYVYSHGRAWCKVHHTATTATPNTATGFQQTGGGSKGQPSAAVITALTNVKGALKRTYDLKDRTVLVVFKQDFAIEYACVF